MTSNKNQLLTEYFNLNQEIAAKEKRLSEIKALIKEWGSVVTKDFICTVSDVSRTALLPISLVAVKLGGMRILEEKGLLHHTSYPTIKVVRRSNVIKVPEDKIKC